MSKTLWLPNFKGSFHLSTNASHILALQLCCYRILDFPFSNIFKICGDIRALSRSITLKEYPVTWWMLTGLNGWFLTVLTFILLLFCLEEALLKLQLLKTKVTVLIFGWVLYLLYCMWFLCARVPSNCQRVFTLSAFDPDGDKVKCRFGDIDADECNPCTPPSVLTISQVSFTYTYSMILQ